LKDEYEPEVIEAIVETLKENPSNIIDPTLTGTDTESLKKR